MPCQVDLAVELPQGTGDGLNLVEITGGIERLPVQQHGGRFVAGLDQTLRLAKQPGDSFAAQIHARVTKKAGDELLGRLDIHPPDQLEGQRAWLGVVAPVEEKLAQLDQRQFAALGQGVPGDHLDRAAKVVRRERIRAVHRRKQRRQRVDTALGQVLQCPAGSLIALPFAANGSQHGHRLVEFIIRRLAKRGQAQHHHCHMQP